MADFGFNFMLPTSSPSLTREMICATCGRVFIWYIHQISNECIVGGEQPTICPYCNGKEVRIRHSEA